MTVSLFGFVLFSGIVMSRVALGQASDEGVTGMVYIPAGEFLMGNQDGQASEKPVHQVVLNAYWIDRYEVTNAEYHAFWIADGAEASRHTPVSYGDHNGVGTWPEIARTKPNYPVVGVRWQDAVAYAAWAGKRLPTEAEWERAACGLEGTLFPWGNSFSASIEGKTAHANTWNGDDGYDNGLAPVGSYPTGRSVCGAFDMCGNVAEWVADWYSPTYYQHSPEENPLGPMTGTWRVIRGGSWINKPEDTLTTARTAQHPDMGTSFIGFRLVKDAH